MKNHTLILGLSCAIAMGVATESMASGDHKGGHYKHHGPKFETLDRDANGQVTLEELTAYRADRFDQADANGDGQISREEMAARFDQDHGGRRSKFIDRVFAKRDANEDGVLSREEAQGDRAARMLERADSDGDGQVSLAEYDAMRKTHHGKRGKHGKHSDKQAQ